MPTPDSYGKDLLKGKLGDMLQHPIQPTPLHSPHFSNNRSGDQSPQDYAGGISPGICRSLSWASVLRFLLSVSHWGENPQVEGASRSGSEWALLSGISLPTPSSGELL